MGQITANKSIIGKGAMIDESVIIRCDNLVIGENVIIEERTKIICPNGHVIIGDHTYIGNDVTIVLKSFEIGEYSKLHNHCLLNGKAIVKIGHNCWIGQNCNLNGEADLMIGNNVGIGTYSSVWTHGYFGELIEGCNIYSIKPTTIEDDVWLVGSYNTIFPGVTIKKKTVLFGTSIITKSTEENNVYSGNPAQNITSKVGMPYHGLSAAEKVKIIRKTLLENLTNVSQVSEEKLIIEGLGEVYFLPSSFPETKDSDVVCFFEQVGDWNVAYNISLFCLTSKLYSKQKTALEITVRKILNPVTARFIPLK